ncbi:MAG: 4-hydroxybenzoate octaprenyltransferase [Proteobacteria bacterium]|nr:4-hydroxybenzoate octaprenyltransferase [Pseudomonadota bacterium]
MSETTARPADALNLSLVDRAPAVLQPFLRLMRLDRPSPVWLLFLPCVYGLVLGAVASERPFWSWHDLYLLVLFAIGSVVMRGAGCTYNDIVDRDIDAQVARTRGRPIPSGAVSVRQAWLFLGAQLAAGLAVLIQLEPFAIAVGAASLVLVAAYPFMKRITWWPQAWLGLTFNWGALVGFAAQTGRIDAADALLYAGLFFWTLGYDTIYALQDKEDDALIGVKSTARLFGARAKDWVLGFYAAAFALVLAAGYADHTGWPFTFVMLAAGGHMLWQAHTLRIDDPDNCLRLFRANRETGLLMAAAFLLSSWFW